MACNCNYDGLLHRLVEKKLSYFRRCLITVHEGHVAIHKDQLEAAPSILLEVFFNQFHCLISVIYSRTENFSVDFTNVLENHFQSLDVEKLVIYYEYFVDFALAKVSPIIFRMK